VRRIALEDDGRRPQAGEVDATLRGRALPGGWRLGAGIGDVRKPCDLRRTQHVEAADRAGGEGEAASPVLCRALQRGEQTGIAEAADRGDDDVDAGAKKGRDGYA